LRDHAQPGTRILHFLGTGLGVAALILGIVTLDPMIPILGMLMGYVFAWSGHFLIERNRPSMLAHPIWSFQCDVRMLRRWLRRAGSGGVPGATLRPTRQRQPHRL